jgi:Family of unknown function (DUF6069)
MATTTLTSSRTTPSIVSYLQTGVIAGVIAAIGNVIVYFVGQALGASFDIIMQPSTPVVPLPIVAIVMFSVVPALGAALLAWALNRYIARGNAIFVGIAVVFLLLSIIPDITMPDPVTNATRLGLIVMHFVAGGVITYMLSRKA